MLRGCQEERKETEVSKGFPEVVTVSWGEGIFLRESRSAWVAEVMGD